MSKITIGMGERLAARRHARGVEDLVARETDDARDDDLVGDEELERQTGDVGVDRIAASHALERGDGGLCPVARIQRGKTAAPERCEKLVRVLAENGVGADLELHDLGTAGSRRQEVRRSTRIAAGRKRPTESRTLWMRAAAA